MHFESSSNIEGCNCTPCTPLTADLYLISLHWVCNNLPTNVGTQEFGYSLQIYQCHLCALVFERKCKLEDHVKRVHNEKCHSIMLDHVEKLHDKKQLLFFSFCSRAYGKPLDFLILFQFRVTGLRKTV